jgi:hypothetical protein
MPQEHIQRRTEVEQDTSGKSAVDGLGSESLLLLELFSGGRGRCYTMIRNVMYEMRFSQILPPNMLMLNEVKWALRR